MLSRRRGAGNKHVSASASAASAGVKNEQKIIKFAAKQQLSRSWLCLRQKADSILAQIDLKLIN